MEVATRKASARVLNLTKTTRVAEITDLIPGDEIFMSGVGYTIEDVGGSIREGILHYTIKIKRTLDEKAVENPLKFMFKLCKI